MLKEMQSLNNLSIIGFKCNMVTNLFSSYQESNNKINREGKNCSSWWKDLQNIEKGLWELRLNWFFEKLRKEIGNDEETRFWDDPWLEGVPLRTRYLGLFVIFDGKNACVRDIVQGEKDERILMFRWKRILTEEESSWEEELRCKHVYPPKKIHTTIVVTIDLFHSTYCSLIINNILGMISSSIC